MIGRILFAIALALTATAPAFGDYKTCMTFCMEQYGDFDHCNPQCSKSSFKADSTPTPKVEAAFTAPAVGTLAIPSADGFEHVRGYKHVLRALDGWLAGRGLDDAALAEYIGVIVADEHRSPDLEMVSRVIAGARFRAKLADLPDPVGPAVERVFAQYFESEGCQIPRTSCLKVSARWWLGGIAFRTDWTNICDTEVHVSLCHKYDDGGASCQIVRRLTPGENWRFSTGTGRGGSKPTGDYGWVHVGSTKGRPACLEQIEGWKNPLNVDPELVRW